MPWKRLAALAAVAGFVLGASGCGGDDSTGGGGAGVVSCDINQAGLHYCEEFHGATSGNTGCTAMTGVTPGTGCTHDGLAGKCSNGTYEIYFYGTGELTTIVAAMCPGGKFEAPGTGGSAGTGS